MTATCLFADPPKTAVLTTKLIVFKNYPILAILHQGEWQFLDGEHVSVIDGSVVELHELIQKDASLKLLADLPEGWQAWRKTLRSPWQRSPL